MENMTETKARFIRENPRYVFKQEVVATEYLKWLEDLARKQLAYNDALQLVSQRSEQLICTFELGVENCGFEKKDVDTCKNFRKCECCAN